MHPRLQTFTAGSGPDGESWLVFWLASDLRDDFRIFARRFVFDSRGNPVVAVTGPEIGKERR